MRVVGRALLYFLAFFLCAVAAGFASAVVDAWLHPPLFGNPAGVYAFIATATGAPGAVLLHWLIKR